MVLASILVRLHSHVHCKVCFQEYIARVGALSIVICQTSRLPFCIPAAAHSVFERQTIKRPAWRPIYCDYVRTWRIACAFLRACSRIHMHHILHSLPERPGRIPCRAFQPILSPIPGGLAEVRIEQPCHPSFRYLFFGET